MAIYLFGVNYSSFITVPSLKVIGHCRRAGAH